MSKVPRSAAWLGGLGVLPFLFCAAALFIADQNSRVFALTALMSYGAVILSFLGGIHWGLAIADEIRTGRDITKWLLLSVTPSLIAWVALMLPAKTGCGVLAVAFVAMLWVDVSATRAGQTPPWYPKLRWPLSLAATASVLVGSVVSFQV